MVTVQRTLIDIASTAHRVIDASVGYARDKHDRNIDISRTRLGGELHRIVAASGTILKETLQPARSSNSTFDDRLTDWLAGEEPQACLDSLNAMEKVFKLGSGRAASTFRNPFRSAPTAFEDKIQHALRIFEKCKDCFHFLLTTDVWNHEMTQEGRSRVPQLTSPGIAIRQGLPFANWVTGVELPAKNRATTKVDQTQLSEILRWLDAWDCTAKHEITLELRQPDTCTWLPDTDEYRTWRGGNNSLWLHGKPGSGKSVLAASVIDNLEHTLLEGELLASFYCDFQSKRSTAAAEVMRSLLCQLLRGMDDLGVDPGDTLDSLDKEKRRQSSILGNVKRLALFASRSAKQFRRQPLIVIDALDECEDIENLLDAILVLSQSGVRLLVVSRPLQVIKDSFSELACISLDMMRREVSADISLHVTREIDSHRRLRIARPALKEEITWMLCDKADGMFRWIQCQLDTLKKCVSTVEVRETLDSLPDGLEETYERILHVMNKEKRGAGIIRRALVWLVAALRPLTLCQLVEALSIDLDRRLLVPDLGPMHGQALLDSLSSLVTHDGKTDTIRLSHFSVKEYLIGKLSQKHLYNIDERDAHAQVARECMGYMAACLEFKEGTCEELHPLVDYVINYGFDHLAYIKPARSILNAIAVLHSDALQHPLEWEQLKIRMRFDVHRLPSLKHDFVLYILIRYASESLLRLFLGRAPLRVKAGTNPLNYVVTGKLEHARTLLSHGAKLDLCGLFVRTYEDDCISGLPIEAAVRSGNRELVDLLLAEGSPIPHKLFSLTHLVNSEDRFLISAHVMARLLQTNQFVEWETKAVCKSSLLHVLDRRNYNFLDRQTEEDVVVMARRLKQIGYNLSGDNTFIEMLVRQAAYGGQITTIKYFLSEFEVPLPPDIVLDAVGNRSSNAAMICFLIQSGANVYVVSADESTALHHAMHDYDCEESCLEMAQVLCKAGCDPSARNLQGRTPMHLASTHGYISVVKHFLSIGAPLPTDILLRALADQDPFASMLEHSDTSKTAGTTRINQPSLRNSLSMICFLQAEGADTCAVATNGDTVLHALLRSTNLRDHLESAKALIAAGCPPGVRNSAGETPIKLAARARLILVLKYLLSLHVPLPRGILLTALQRNSRRLNYDLVATIKLLLDNGADRHATSLDGGNVLHHIIKLDDRPGDSVFQAFKTLVDAGCDLFKCSSDGETLLHVAARHGHLEVIQYLLSRGLPLPSDILLVVFYSTQLIQFLVNMGGDVRAVAADGDTPLHFATRSYSESCALEVVKILIKAGSDPSALNSFHKTPMHSAAESGHASVISFLLQQGADPTSITTDGDTALHLTLAHGWKSDCSETVKILIDAGCDIHACNSTGETPLLAAAKGGYVEVVEHLLSQGALVPSSAFLATASCPVYRKKVPIIRLFATLEGPDIHAITSDGDTVLHVAVSTRAEDCVEVVKAFVGLGCNPMLCNLAGETPLHISAKYQQIPVLKYLLSLGIPLPSDILISAAAGVSGEEIEYWYYKMVVMMHVLIREGADPCATNGNGDAPLHIILENHPPASSYEKFTQCWEAIQILLDAGGDPYARNQDGQTPIDLAEKKGSSFAQNFMRLVKDARNVCKHGLTRICDSVLTKSSEEHETWLVLLKPSWGCRSTGSLIMVQRSGLRGHIVE